MLHDTRTVIGKSYSLTSEPISGGLTGQEVTESPVISGGRVEAQPAKLQPT